MNSYITSEEGKSLRLAAEKKKRELAKKLTEGCLEILKARTNNPLAISLYTDILYEEILFCCLAMGDQLEPIVSNGN